MSLKEITELAVNNDECVVLKVKDGHELDLIGMGCFSGDETMLRLTKGNTVTCTVFRKNGNSFSWHWGFNGYTLVTDQVQRMGRLSGVFQNGLVAPLDDAGHELLSGCLVDTVLRLIAHATAKLDVPENVGTVHGAKDFKSGVDDFHSIVLLSAQIFCV